MREKNGPDKDLRIANIVEEYKAALDRGEIPSIEAILSAHKDIADELRVQLEMTGLLRRTSAKLSPEQKQVMTEELEHEVTIEQEMQSPEYQKKRDEASQRILSNVMAEYEKRIFKPVDRRQDVFLLLLYLRGRHNRLAEAIWGNLRLAKNLFYIGMKTSINSLVKDYYNYKADACGPFTNEIFKDIKNLKLAGLITDEPPRLKKVTTTEDINIAVQPAQVSAVYKLTDKGIEIAQDLYQWTKLNNPELLRRITQIKVHLAEMTPEQMVQEIEKEYPEYTKFCKLLKKELNSGESK